MPERERGRPKKGDVVLAAPALFINDRVFSIERISKLRCNMWWAVARAQLSRCFYVWPDQY